MEIASLVDVGCIIAAGEEFSRELEEQLDGMPPYLRHASSPTSTGVVQHM